MLEHDLSLTHPGSDSMPAFHEVCRSVLNPGSLSFVAANAPWEVVHSFEAPPATTRKLFVAARESSILRTATPQDRRGNK